MLVLSFIGGPTPPLVDINALSGPYTSQVALLLLLTQAKCLLPEDNLLMAPFCARLRFPLLCKCTWADWCKYFHWFFPPTALACTSFSSLGRTSLLLLRVSVSQLRTYHCFRMSDHDRSFLSMSFVGAALPILGNGGGLQYVLSAFGCW